jgi:hypothetical protein
MRHHPGSSAPSSSLSAARLARRVACGLLILAGGAGMAYGFCGFYVAKADSHLYNQASQVVLVRDGDRTVMTMANDFKGDPKEFAVVIPVPTALQREQIHVADKALIDHLDAYSAPRLVEYFDPDPCAPIPEAKAMRAAPAPQLSVAGNIADRAHALGVTIEATYTVGEYDILILSAKQSDGLTTWLRESGYKVPAGALPVLGSYIRQGLHFFVAKVNLTEQSKLGFTFLRPLQVAYESPRFMLPIRLGMVNAAGPQELFVYAVTRHGRVETTNYRTVKMPQGEEVPLFVKDQFGTFYKAMFSHQVEREGMRTVFAEYAWDMGWCDPCAAEPLSRQELRNLGVFWLQPDDGNGNNGPVLRRPGGRGPVNGEVFLTRLHVRYDAEHFPEDLAFQETGDRDNFQGRFVISHPWTRGATCEAAAPYQRQLHERWDREAQNLASLTGWGIDDIRHQMNLRAASAPASEQPWWKSLWNQ